MKLFKKSLTIVWLLLTCCAPDSLKIESVSPLFSAVSAPVEKHNESDLSADLGSSKPAAGEKYIIDKNASVVQWRCSMVFASKGGHNGFVSISKGELMMEKDKLTGGTVEVDMNTIADEKHRSDNGLIEHLKSVDFFDVEKFPTAAFAITRVAAVDSENMNVTGILVIKGVTNEVTFPAKVEVKDRVVTATGKLTIDRTKWEVFYRSGKFFASLADEAISDDIHFDVNIVAKK